MAADANDEREHRMGLVDRAKNIIVTPKTEWPVIAAQTTRDSQVILGYVVPLAAIAALAGFIGLSLVGISVPIVGTTRIGAAAGLVTAIYNVIMAVAMVYVLAFIIDLLAPTFGAQKAGVSQALKVSAYAYTPVWIASIATIIPALGILVLVAAIYAIYLLYLGLQAVVNAPQEKAAGYTAVIVIAGIAAGLVIAFIGGAIGAVSGAGMGVGRMSMRGAPTTIDRAIERGRLEALNRKLDEASKRMDEAQKSGDPSKQMEAALGALGTVISGGKAVEPVQLDALKPFVPEQFAGLPRTDLRTDRSGVKGFMVAKAEAVYGDGAGKRVTLDVTDTGGASGLMGFAAWMGIQGEHEDGNRREVTRQENGRLVHEETSKHGGDNQYTVVLAERFVVGARGRGVDLDTLKSAVNGLDLARIAALR
jgi:hypothetical protein